MPKQSVRNDRAVKLIRQGVDSLGVRGLARAIGVSPAIITRYMQGDVAEPSQATLEKISEFFSVRERFLRGYTEPLDRIIEGVKALGYTRETFNQKMAEQRDEGNEESVEDAWGFFLEYDEPLPKGIMMYLCRLFGINRHWVEHGTKPMDGSGGFVGEVNPQKRLKVIEGVAFIPGGASDGGDIVVQAVTCAKCGGVLKRAELRPGEAYAISYWPCETCCKH